MGNESSKTKPGKTINSLGLRVGPSQSTIQRHVDNARKSRILQLKSCGLKSIPHALNELQDIIRSLELSQNKIKEIPSSIGQFSALKQLHLSENIISVLPDEIGQLNSLEILNLQSNKLSTLPETIVGCTALKTINISANSFSQFPIAVCYLTSLDTLNLAQNTITALPDEVSSLNATEVNLNQNRLNFLNADVLVKCPHLKILRLEENCLTKTEFTENFLSRSNVSIICYSGNIFQEREFQDLPGYDEYQHRFTATRRKI